MTKNYEDLHVHIVKVSAEVKAAKVDNFTIACAHPLTAAKLTNFQARLNNRFHQSLKALLFQVVQLQMLLYQ